jgi:hypothetical protein
MDKNLKQKILNELKRLLSEQSSLLFMDPAPTYRQDREKKAADDKQALANSLKGGAEAAQFLYDQDNSYYITSSERQAIIAALQKVITIPLQAQAFLSEWKRLHDGQDVPISIRTIDSELKQKVRTLGRTIASTAKTNISSATPKEPASTGFVGPQHEFGARYKFSFSCRNPLSVGIYQQWLGVSPDCKAGTKTIQAQVAKTGIDISIGSYIPADGPPGPEHQKNQALFCQGLEKNLEGYKKDLAKRKITPITQCLIAKKKKRPVKAAAPTAPNTGTGEDKTAPEASDVQRPIKESLSFSDKLKLNEAKKTFKKLVKKLI